MLNFSDILSFYPERMRMFRENILKEYLQYKILDCVFSTEYAKKLVFIGGTSIRIVHGGIRFSEDLDFDNRGLSQNDFTDLADLVSRHLQLDGFTVEMRTVYKGAFHCYIKFPGLLFETGLSGYKSEKILIQLDSEPQHYEYSIENYLINRFGIFRYIHTVPIGILLSQKISTVLQRKREKGRDFFDVVYLWSKTEPDFGYLEVKLGISSKKDLVSRLKEKSNNLDFRKLAREIEPFLFDPAQKERVMFFPQWLETLKYENGI